MELSKTQLSTQMQTRGFIPIIDKIIWRTLKLKLEVLKSMNRAKGKNIVKALLDAGYNFIDNKCYMKLSPLFSLRTNASKQWDKIYYKSN